MSITLYDVVPSLAREGCAERVIMEAIRSSRQVAKIVWDGPDTPEHCRGYVQWSVRPFSITDRCDGTRDSNAMLVCLDFCKSTELDLSRIYAEAYPENRNCFADTEYLAHLEEHRSETVIPEVTEDNVVQLLNSLYSMNWRSLVEILAAQWLTKGFNTDDYWERD